MSDLDRSENNPANYPSEVRTVGGLMGKVQLYAIEWPDAESYGNNWKAVETYARELVAQSIEQGSAMQRVRDAYQQIENPSVKESLTVQAVDAELLAAFHKVLGMINPEADDPDYAFAHRLKERLQGQMSYPKVLSDIQIDEIVASVAAQMSLRGAYELTVPMLRQFLAKAEQAQRGGATRSVPFKPETWPTDADGFEANLCTECGTPTRYGSRHSSCDPRNIAAAQKGQA